MNPQAQMSAIGRWTKPGFFDRNFGKPTPDVFATNRRANTNLPIEMKFGPVHLRWEDGHWINMNLDEHPAHPAPSITEISQLQRENSQLQVECEILLHMLTVSEMKKVKAQNKLQEIKGKISDILAKIEDQEKSDD